MDLPESAENLKELKKKVRGLKIIPVSAATDGSFDELKELLHHSLRELRNKEQQEQEEQSCR